MTNSQRALSDRPERKAVELRAYAVRPCGGILDMRVVDFCFDGCRVECDAGLIIGEELKLSLLGRGAIKARVRWSDGRNAGMQFEVERKGREHCPRQIERTGVAGEVSVRRPGRPPYRVKAFDASRFGCKCEFVERPSIGEHLWIKFDGLESLDSEVRWVEDSAVGLNFITPLHPAVFDLLLQRLT
jgi:hypothetical protein